MAVQKIIPDVIIDGSDVRDTLNAYGGTVGNGTNDCFEMSAGIDMWSRYKPVIDKRVLIPLDEWKESAYRGSDGKCGLTILSLQTSMADFRQYLMDGTALWTYTPPIGVSEEPRRMDDFRGYNPAAENPVGDLVTSGFAENGSSDVYGDVTFSVEVSAELENNLMLDDIRIGGTDGTPLTDFYFGIFAWKSESVWVYKTNDVPIGEQYSFDMTIPMLTGEWMITPFFCSVAQDGITENEGIYVGANIKTRKVTILSSNDMVVITVNGTWNKDRSVVQNIFVAVKNNSSDELTLDNIGIQLRATDGTEDKNVGVPATVYYNGNESNTLKVAAGESVVTDIGEFGNLTLGDSSESYEYYLNAFGYVGDTIYRHTNGIEEEEN